MCGIAGSVGSNNSEVEVRRALETIRHRGPSDSGTWVAGKAIIGMVRLSIIDIEHGHQPMVALEDTVGIVFNGEIYNYRELRLDLSRRGHCFNTDSDTEVLLRAYLEFGTRCVDHLEGMFAFAVYDRRDGSLILARDRFGKKPLYFSETDGGIVFASELKAVRDLLLASRKSVRISDQAVYDYLSLGVVPQPSTIYEGVKTLPPAHVASWKDGVWQSRHYWEPTFGPKRDDSREASAREVRRLIRDATAVRLQADVPLGVFLSGGVDSSVVAYEAAKIVGPALQTFTVATGGALDESAIAARTAKKLGVKHKIIPITVDPLNDVQRIVAHYDQPFADSSAIPSMAISRAAAEHVTVVLNGDGGDEVFGGYRRHIAALQLARLGRVPQPVFEAVHHVADRLKPGRRHPLGFLDRVARGMLQDPSSRYFAWTTDMFMENDKAGIWRKQAKLPTERLVKETVRAGLSHLDQQLFSDISLNLLSDLLVKMDMATMAASIEARSPLLDHRLADYVWRLPDHVRLNARSPKALLRRAYSGILSDEVLLGKKKGFEVQMSQWLDGPLAPIWRDLVLDPNSKVKDYIDPEAIVSLTRGDGFTERNVTYIRYSILVLELWLRRQSIDDRSGGMPI